MVSSLFEGRRAQQNGDAAAVLPEVLLLDRQPDSSPFVLFDPLCVALAPVPRGQIVPVDATRRKVITVVSDDPEKRVIGLENPTVEVPDEDADDVRVDQAPYSREFSSDIAACVASTFNTVTRSGVKICAA